MSSLIEWPTIYGSVYFLPGIIVVVLLLLLMLLMSSRRRAKAERARLAPEPALAFASPESEEPEEGEPPAPAPETTTYPDYSPGVMTRASRGDDADGRRRDPACRPAHPAGDAAQYDGPGAQHHRSAAVRGSLPHSGPAAGVRPPTTVAAPDATAEPVMAASATTDPIAAAPALDVTTEPDPMFEPVKSSRRAKSKAARDAAPLSVVSTVNAPVGEDPLNATIQEIMNGWGDLAPEDMKRLELFRPDCLNAALVAVQLPKTKSNDAKLRLTQMRQYGIGLERRAQAIQTVEAAAAAATESTGALSADPTPTGGALRGGGDSQPRGPGCHGDHFHYRDSSLCSRPYQKHRPRSSARSTTPNPKTSLLRRSTMPRCSGPNPVRSGSPIPSRHSKSCPLRYLTRSRWSPSAATAFLWIPLL